MIYICLDGILLNAYLEIGCLAQLGEYRLYTAEVVGSSPSASTKIDIAKDGGVAKRLNAADCKSAPSGSAVRICPPPPPLLGCSQAVRQQTLTLSSRWFDPTHPSQKDYDSLAQSVEHLTFNQGVRSSNLRRVTNFYTCPGGGIGRRTGLKILRMLNPYRFDSGPGHH